jgi:hypothetical protein
VNDLGSTLFWLRLGQLLIAIPLLSIVGQGVVFVLARAFGQDPQTNFFYRLLAVVTSPITRLCRYITPKIVAERHLPLVALSLLAVAYVWSMFAIADACHRHGLAVAQCLAGR